MTQDRWTALACLAFAVFVIAVMPGQTSDRPIPGARGFDLLDGAFFPKVAVSIFLIASIWLFFAGRPKPIQDRKDGDTDAARLTSEAEDEPPGLTPWTFFYAVGLTVLVLVYVQLLDPLGYLLSTILAVAVLALICGQRSWLGLLLGAVAFPAVVYYVFNELFRVPLPRADIWFF